MYSRLSPLCRSRHGRLLLPSLARSPGHLPELRRSHSHSLSFCSSDSADQLHDSRLGFVCRELEGLQSLQPITTTQKDNPGRRVGGGSGRREGGCAEEVEVSHRWPEWVELMERLLRSGYLDRYGLHGGSATASKDANRVRTACLNFARHRVDLIRYLSSKDIQIIVGSGCPSLDRKVVNSGKRLRAHVGIEEGKVCCSCNLRGNCERAYLNARKDERGRTMDVMRILLTHGLGFITGSVEKKSCLTRTVEESARRLLHEMVEFSVKEDESDSEDMTTDSGRLSTRMGKFERKQPPSQVDALMKQGDWICPKCNFLNFAKNIKCLRCDAVSQEKLRKLKEEYEHLPLKKGDWICDKCNFLNFAKNTKCLQCNDKPGKRLLNPGEWECVSCNYINFRRNAICLKCNWKRPKASSDEGSSAAYQHNTRVHRKPPSISFVRNEDDSNVQCPVELERAEEGSDFWSTSDEEDCDNMTHMPTDFKDFQIAGGRSAISQHPLGKEREQVETSKPTGALRKQVKKDVSAMGSIRPGIPRFCESCSEDEMAGWFGYPKKEKKGS